MAICLDFGLSVFSVFCSELLQLLVTMIFGLMAENGGHAATRLQSKLLHPADSAKRGVRHRFSKLGADVAIALKFCFFAETAPECSLVEITNKCRRRCSKLHH